MSRIQQLLFNTNSQHHNQKYQQNQPNEIIVSFLFFPQKQKFRCTIE